jgi:hypothetical protein
LFTAACSSLRKRAFSTQPVMTIMRRDAALHLSHCAALPAPSTNRPHSLLHVASRCNRVEVRSRRVLCSHLR